MKQLFRGAAFGALLLISTVPVTTVAEDRDEFMERAKALFLCEWRTDHLPNDNSNPLDICSNPQQPIQELRVQLKDWWGHYFVRFRQTFEDEWIGGPAETRAQKAWAHKQQDLQAQMTAANAITDVEEDKRFAIAARQMSNTALCLAYREKGIELARAELRRRKALTNAEWELVDRHTINIGMTEVALLCSLGPTEVNETVTSNVEHKQYVYPNRVYVYVVNGRITSYQLTER